MNAPGILTTVPVCPLVLLPVVSPGVGLVDSPAWRDVSVRTATSSVEMIVFVRRNVAVRVPITWRLVLRLEML